MNNISIVGRAGKDPESKFFESGKVKTTFTVATTRPTKEKETDWFNVEFWGKTAEVAKEYVKSGSLVGVTGSLIEEKWTDDNGNKKSKWVLKGDRLDLLGSKKDNAPPAGEDEVDF